MGLIVQKFGGTSVKDRDRIFNVARIVANTRNQGNDVVVVVSAQASRFPSRCWPWRCRKSAFRPSA